MRDQHDRAIEVAERLGQRFAHFQIEMVGGLVEQQHVGLAPGDQRKCQARAFATREAIDALEGAVTRELPAAEIVAEILRRHAGRDVAQMVDRRLAGVQRFDRVLGEVAQHEIGMCGAFAGEQRQFAHQRLDQGRFAGAVGAKQADAVARFERELDAAQDRHVIAFLRDVVIGRPRLHATGHAIAGLDRVQAQQRVRQLERLRQVDADLALGAHGLGTGELGQPLHARLCLLGLAGLGLEAVDEGLQVRAFGLFLLECDLLQTQVLGTLVLETRVVARVELGAAFVQVQRVGAQAVEELAVVRDHQQHAWVLLQPLLQPEHRIEVEVIGRFVEQQQVGRLHEGTGKVEAHAPATRKFGHGHAVGRRPEAEAMQQASSARLGVVAVDFGQPLVRGGDAIPILGDRRRLLGLEDRVHFAVARYHEIDRRIGQRGRFLRHAGDAQRLGQVDVTLVGFDFAHDGGKQARLATAVAADDADLGARMQGDVDVGQQQAFAAAQGEISERDHGTGIDAGRGL